MQQEEILQCFILDDTALKTVSRMKERGLKVNRNTVNYWFMTFRRLIADSTKNTPRFKGRIEMDQTFFGHRRKQKKKKRVQSRRNLAYGMLGIGYRPGYRKRRQEDLVQVFGIIQTAKGKKPSQVYTHIIRRADRKTLVPIVHLIADGAATLYTDNHRSFDKLAESGYKHGIINKMAGPGETRKWWAHDKKNTKDLQNIYVNNIESFWSFCKGRLEQFKGISRETYPLHIRECEFRFNHKHDLKKELRRLINSPA